MWAVVEAEIPWPIRWKKPNLLHALKRALAQDERLAGVLEAESDGEISRIGRAGEDSRSIAISVD